MAGNADDELKLPPILVDHNKNLRQHPKMTDDNGGGDDGNGGGKDGGDDGNGGDDGGGGDEGRGDGGDGGGGGGYGNGGADDNGGDSDDDVGGNGFEGGNGGDDGCGGDDKKGGDGDGNGYADNTGGDRGGSNDGGDAGESDGDGVEVGNGGDDGGGGDDEMGVDGDGRADNNGGDRGGSNDGGDAGESDGDGVEVGNGGDDVGGGDDEMGVDGDGRADNNGGDNGGNDGGDGGDDDMGGDGGGDGGGGNGLFSLGDNRGDEVRLRRRLARRLWAYRAFGAEDAAGGEDDDAIEEVPLGGNNDPPDSVGLDMDWASECMIYRFPPSLQRFGTERDYIVPKTVAFGPYHHKLPEVQQMEQVKRDAIEYFAWSEVNEMDQQNQQSFTDIARKQYDFYSDRSALKGIEQDEFRRMMFVDGSFLLLFIRIMSPGELDKGLQDSRVTKDIKRNAAGIQRDMMLLENQIPWEVIQFLMSIRGMNTDHIISFLVGSCVFPSLLKQGAVSRGLDIDAASIGKQSQLLGLLSYCAYRNRKRTEARSYEMPRTTNASELEKIGLTLRASKVTHFLDMKVTKGLFKATVSLPPLDMDNVSACLLTNMVALEMCTFAVFQDYGYPLSSYLCVLGLLMNQENEVRKLRLNRILQGSFGDQQTLDFFKGLCPNLIAGQAYLRFFQDIEEYRQKWRVRVFASETIYKHGKTVFKMIPIISLLLANLTLSLKNYLSK